MKNFFLLFSCFLPALVSYAQSSTHSGRASSSVSVNISVKIDTGSFYLARHNSAGVPVIKTDQGSMVSYQLFPDPASDNITIKINTASPALVGLQIYNSSGALIKRLDNISIGNTFSYTFPVADYPAGTYFLKIISPDGSLCKSIGFVKL